MVFTASDLSLRDKLEHSFDSAPTGSQVNLLTTSVGSVSIINVPINVTNIESGTAHATSGASLDTSNLGKTTVSVSVLTNGSGTGTGSQCFIQIQHSHNGGFDGEEDTLDIKRYESGTAAQTDTFSYNSHLSFIRTKMIGSNVGAMDVSTEIHGRGA